MPPNVPPEKEEKFRHCKEKVMAGGQSEEAAYGICYNSVVLGKAEAVKQAAEHGFILLSDDDAIKGYVTLTDAPVYNSPVKYAVKAIGDWELDVTAIPFNSQDSDRQFFDAETDTMPDTFKSPLVVYYHGINPGRDGYQANPEVLGKAISMEKQPDGWHVRVLLDKTKELAKRIWDAAKNGLAAASSGSIAHLARMDGGKPYDKRQPGRIAVWPFAELSLIDVGEGRAPANPYAVALPAMKAIYQEAGLPFPEIEFSENDEPTQAIKAAKIARKNLQKQARLLLTTFEE